MLSETFGCERTFSQPGTLDTLRRHSGICERAPIRNRTNEEAIEISLHQNLSREWGCQRNKIIQTLQHQRELTTIPIHKPRVSTRSSCNNFVRRLASQPPTAHHSPLPFLPIPVAVYSRPPAVLLSAFRAALPAAQRELRSIVLIGNLDC
jgi:hypothetical protein